MDRIPATPADALRRISITRAYNGGGHIYRATVTDAVTVTASQFVPDRTTYDERCAIADRLLADAMRDAAPYGETY